MIVLFSLLFILLPLNYAFDYERKRFSDPWCTTFCASQSACLERFPHDFVDLQLQVRFNQTIFRRYGQTVEYGIYLGETISRQTFETQFVTDISTAVEESPCRFYVTRIEPFYLQPDVNTLLLVSFRLISVNITMIRRLTSLVQDPESSMFEGRITKYIDRGFGLVVLKWDFSVKLMYHLSTIVGHESLDHRTVIQDGSLRACSKQSQYTSYCEFELLFRQDMAKALSIPEHEVDVIFVTSSGLDAIIVTFRFIPPNETMFVSQRIDSRIKELVMQISDIDSSLYRGNVTHRIDPTWGISNLVGTQSERFSTKFLNLPILDLPYRAYDRCKDTRSCVRASSNYIPHDGEIRSTVQFYRGGKSYRAALFIDFEDWRQGTAGWKQGCYWETTMTTCKPRSLQQYKSKPKGAHWSPFAFNTSGPNIPTYNGKMNQGLVLNMERKAIEIQLQKEKIHELEALVQWFGNAMQSVSLGPSNRFRKDIISRLVEDQKLYLALLRDEQERLVQLSSSQCSPGSCVLLFNTSNLLMSGTIEARGSIATTPDGTEVVVWAFDSIDLGHEVVVKTTGQRAMALLSRSSIYVNTSINVRPGTLGGFPGGYSVARSEEYRLHSICQEDRNDDERERSCYGRENCCPGDISLSNLASTEVSNNINGPGSQSVRVYFYTIETSSHIVNEIRTLRIDSIPGQKIGGGFQLHYGCYSTTTVAYNVSADALKVILENSLNAADIASLSNVDRSKRFCAGIGKVQVSRYAYGTAGGFEWRITFISAVGFVRPLTFTSFLSGRGSSISVNTLVSANVIQGSFSLSFLGYESRPLPYNITAADMKTALTEDLLRVTSADVVRTDPTGNCDDGLCLNGPTRSLGYTWSLMITTTVGTISPKTPTSTIFDAEEEIEKLKVVNHLEGCINHQCPIITVNAGFNASSMQSLRSLNVARPFSLAYGAGGGSYGGCGGQGSKIPIVGKTYGDKFLTNLLGGSGGSSGLKELYQLNMLEIFSKARGGSGGGAIELVAQNDIVLGDQTILSCNGESGWDNFSTAGGGGSGGSILISAGGSVRISGILSSAGGAGGLQRNSIEIDRTQINSSGGGGGGRIAIYGQSISIDDPTKLSVIGGACQSRFHNSLCAGENGTIYLENGLQQQIFTNPNGLGAMETRSAMIVKGIPIKNREKLSRLKLFQNGPEWILQQTEQPARISFFTKLESSSNHIVGSWGSLFEVRSRSWADILNDRDAQSTSAIAIFIGDHIRHASNIFYVPFDTHHLDSMTTIHNNTQLGIWYKIDIFLNWEKLSYEIRINDDSILSNFPFSSSGIHSVAISNIHPDVDAWFDEIYVGDDTNLGFQCSHFLNGDSKQYGWSQDEYNRFSSTHEMRHHESHISQRKIYLTSDHGGLPFYDGEGHDYFKNAVKFKDGDETWVSDPLKASALLTASSSSSSEKTKYFYFGEYVTNASSRSNTDRELGGVFACSTTNFLTWKNEGLMLSFNNLTNMVDGLQNDLVAKRPKVLYNPKTHKYVMWMILENKVNDLGLTGVAISDLAEGPFHFVRSFYPDGNKTKDQTLHVNQNGSAFLVRTYYATVDYLLPEAVMQPIWESVKDDKGETNFGLNYHRANYEPGYDNFHDIEGNLTMYGIQSRFLNPDKPEHNVWLPNSVVGVKAQPWKANYRDGSCGIRSRNDEAEFFDPNRTENRANCSNIVDNPTHPTSADRRIGLEKIVEQRLAKYVAVSKLTSDFLDTTGAMTIYEGGLEDASGLVSLLDLLGIEGVGWDTNKMLLKSTYAPPIRSDVFLQEENWDTLFHQYEETFNDRAYYSLACILDNMCPVNFKVNENAMNKD